MPSGQTKLTICNAALDVLHETALSSLADDRPVARWLGREYDRLRDTMLASHTWNFASARAAIAANATAPAFGWVNSYNLPSDFIRVHYLNRSGKHNGSPIPYEIDGGVIVTDEPAPLKLRYIRREVLEGNFDILACNVLAAMIAVDLSHWITGKTSYTQIAEGRLRAAINAARRIDGMQGTAQQVNDSDVINARFA